MKTLPNRELGPFREIPSKKILSIPGYPKVVMPGSDKKVSGDVWGNCYLCHEEKVLLLSHIIPNWMSKWAKAETPEGYLIGSVNAMNSYVKLDDIEKQYMLCNECEQYLGTAENYLKNICSGTKKELALQRMSVIHGGSDISYLLNCDYKLLLRSLMGIVYKINFSHVFPHALQSFPNDTIRKIRISLLSDNYDELGLDIVAIKWMNGLKSGNPRSAMFTSLQRSDDGEELFYPLFAGISWFVSFNGVRIPDFSEEAHFSSNRIPFILADIRENLRIFDDEKFESAKDKDRFTDDPKFDWWMAEEVSLCPCGNEVIFADCCQKTWALDARQRFHR